MDSDHDQVGVGVSNKVTGIRDDETISCAADLYGAHESGEPFEGNIGCNDPLHLGGSAALLHLQKRDERTWS